jgi:hypothetical protein
MRVTVLRGEGRIVEVGKWKRGGIRMRVGMEMRTWISRSGSSIVLLYESVKKRSIERKSNWF